MSGMPGAELNQTDRLQEQITTLRTERNHLRGIVRGLKKGKERAPPSEAEVEGNLGETPGDGSRSGSEDGSSQEGTTTMMRHHHPFGGGGDLKSLNQPSSTEKRN